MLIQSALYFQAAVFGLIVGSFLNVCVYRVPRQLSMGGRSYCPLCATPIPFYRNVPVVTYLLQWGKTACCRKPISIQYPAVEFVTGVLSVAVFAHATSLASYFVWFLLFICPLIVISVIDFQIKIIPDVISLSFMVVGVGVVLWERFPDILGALKFSVLGILIGGGSLLLIAEVVSRLKGVDAMGGGDIKLAAMLGAFLGWKSLVFIFFASSVVALFYILILRIARGPEVDRQIPFGPFLSMGGIIYFLYGRALTDFYFFHSGFSRNPFFD